jgi:hypothetical protein
VVEAGGGAGFVQEALARGFVGGELGAKELDGYDAVEALVAGAIDDGGSALADFVEEDVATREEYAVVDQGSVAVGTVIHSGKSFGKAGLSQ